MDIEFLPAEEAPQTPRNKKKNKMKKKRFSDEQIKLLESIFESETKLEPRKKMQLARDLELQPRQIAIWFQNRRARWKSKRIEQDYNTLKANYDNLESRFESLKKEKQSLMLQMQKLSELLREPNETNKAGTSETEADAQPSFRGPGLEDREFLGLQQSVNHRDDVQQTGQAGEEFLIMDEYMNESPATPEKLYGFGSPDMFDHSCTNYQWLNFWT